jgi:hypothetical protein
MFATILTILNGELLFYFFVKRLEVMLSTFDTNVCACDIVFILCRWALVVGNKD